MPVDFGIEPRVLDSITLIFVEIVELTKAVLTVSHHQLLSYVNDIYETFESVADEFPGIVTIKMCDQLYVGVLGLSGEMDVADQVIRAVDFCIRMNNEIEGIGRGVELGLPLRMIVNNGGPVVFGALSAETPVLEVIGKVVFETKAMLADGQPGAVQIGRGIKQWFPPSDFIVREESGTANRILVVERKIGADKND
jgi:hypothetical protein